VLALQEVDRDQARSGGADQTRVVAEALGAVWWRFVPAVVGVPGEAWEAVPHRADEEHPAGDAHYGIGLASRLPVLSWSVVRFPAAPLSAPLLIPNQGVLWVADEPRLAIVAVLEGPSGPCTVVATHCSFVPGFNVRQLRILRRRLTGMPGPRFLLGDFNLPGALPRWVTGMDQLVRTATYPSWQPRVQFDHVLADGLPAGAVTGTAVHRLGVSDHCGLTVDVQL
jgi:endonuclease/exonuclease/phosphatase family metal-dependent hydrolase